MNGQSQLLLRAIKGPVIMITLGVLFAIDKFSGYSFRQTFPVLLIVIGIMQLLGGRRVKADYIPPPSPVVTSPPPFRPAETPRAESGLDQNQEPRA